MIDRLKLPFAFDPQQLKADLQVIDDSSWLSHFVTDNYEGNWSAIALRIPIKSIGQHPIASLFSHWGDEGWVDSPLLKETPYFKTILDTFQCPLTSVRLMRLTPGSEIKEHCDPDLDFEDGFVRIHIPIQTNDDVEFYLNNQRVILPEGECWYLRLADPHRIHNKGSTDRIHLVIDAKVNPWLEDIFERSSNYSSAAQIHS